MYSHPIANRCLKNSVNGISWKCHAPCFRWHVMQAWCLITFSSAKSGLHCSAVVWPCVERAQPALLAAAARAHLQGQARQCIPCKAGVALLLARLSPALGEAIVADGRMRFWHEACRTQTLTCHPDGAFCCFKPTEPCGLMCHLTCCCRCCWIS